MDRASLTSSDVAFNSAVEVMPGVIDWSTLHQPSSSKLYEYSKDKSDWNEYRLSTEQVAQYWRDGYLANIPILTDEQCDLILKEYDYYLGGECSHPGRDLLYEFHASQTPNDPNNVLIHVLGHWRLTEIFHDLVFHPKVVVPCSQLVIEGRQDVKIRLWHDQLFAKPPKCGGVVAWHQDYSYWTRTQPQMHVTVHIALDEQTEENGCVTYIPGSHRWNRNGEPLPVLDFNFKDMEGIQSILTDTEKEQFKPQKVLLKKGHANIHHSMVVHGSYANKSDGPRRAAVLNYFADGVVSNTDSFLLCPNGPSPYHDAANIPKGHKMHGQFYPVVFDPQWLNR
jgi:hypothetical protein